MSNPALGPNTDNTVSNEDLHSRRKREQVRQACQSCRRRKIKCDEARPVCNPCSKGKLPCGYELPTGQTRNQALSQELHRVQGRLHTYTSLIHALRCMDSEDSHRILYHLRRGSYDGMLQCNNSTSELVSQADRVYPWGGSSMEQESQSQSYHTVLPPISDLVPMQGDSSVVCPKSHNTPGILGRPQERCLGYDAPALMLAPPCATSLGLQPTLEHARIVTEHFTCSRDGESHAQ